MKKLTALGLAILFGIITHAQQKAPKEPPHGYRSCVEYLSKDDVLSCGINGVDHSFNGGKVWSLISKEGFNVCRIAKIGTAIFLAGNNGKIAKIVWK
jgi:hypothetical protein